MIDMTPTTYLVIKIDGDYALLRRLEEENAEPISVARALLPENIQEGSRLLREFLEYTLLD
ncbi:chorismate--pyruvate lyase [Hominifimenecus sp. rT4P-3]|uniref:chorismate--pyruvate lyase n=1 Tax=Hominifimenecus sp. rT4P-3 TaxID=3242979 RepID=UPI003DA54D3D